MEINNKTDMAGVAGAVVESEENRGANLLDATRLCRELLCEVDKARKKYKAANIVDIIAALPLIGIPFGMVRTVYLSDAAEYMDIVDKLCFQLSDVLSRLDMAAGLESKDALAYKFKGVFGDYRTLTFSPDNYMNEAYGWVKDLKKEVIRISEQLQKLPES